MSGALPRLNSGDLRSPIQLRRLSELDDGKGGFVTSPETIATTRAEVQGQGGREAVIDRTLQGIAVYRLRVRWRAGILPADQIVLPDGTLLNIRSITDPNGDREQLVIFADTAGVQSA